MSDLSPQLVARLDQDRAALRDLTDRAADHTDCPTPEVCAAAELDARLVDVDGRTLRRRLALAALHLAARQTFEAVDLSDLEYLAVEAGHRDPGSLSHEQTAGVIAEILERIDPAAGLPHLSALRAAAVAVLAVHVACPAETPGPDPQCARCEGTGFECGEHCCCGCPWCDGCGGAPVCGGPCPTVAAIYRAIRHLHPTTTV